ncbi:MAG: hypothetical protein HY718_12750 [Planctomycetes bacterium]|nr:hypothetical protein [Planctomycetota bacterium]
MEGTCRPLLEVLAELPDPRSRRGQALDVGAQPRHRPLGDGAGAAQGRHARAPASEAEPVSPLAAPADLTRLVRRGEAVDLAYIYYRPDRTFFAASLLAMLGDRLRARRQSV